MPCATPGDSPGIAGRFDPGAYRVTASALGSRACEILYVPFKSEVSISCSPMGLSKNKPHWPSKLDVLGAHLPGAGPLGWVTQYRVQTLNLGKDLNDYGISFSVNCQPRGVHPDCTMSASVLILPWFFLCH